MTKRRATNSPPYIPRRMASTDALFWYAETALPIFRPIIGGLYILDRPPDAERMEACHDAALALVPRLRQRVLEAPLQLGLPEWVHDAHFDRSYHVRHVSLPDPGSLRELLDFTATALGTPLDRERPLWEATWIDGLEEGRAAYFFKMHHSLVDGVGSVAILNALTQPERDAAPPPAPPEPQSHQYRSPPDALERLSGLVLDNARATGRLALGAMRAPLDLALHPQASLDRALRTARGLRGVVADLTTPPVRDPLARDTSGLSRRLDVAQVSLERLRKIKAPLGVTINDVILAALATTLRAYHRERKVRVETLNCMVPMNLRGRDEKDLMGNRVGMFNISLPLAERRLAKRLELITAQTGAAKSDKRGAAAPFLVEALTFIPGAALRWLARNSLGRVNVACTNVPGVPQQRYLAGAAVEAIHPFASVVEGTPLVMALLSYAGTMNIGIDTDPEAISDPQRITALFERALDEMENLSSRGRAPKRNAK